MRRTTLAALLIPIIAPLLGTGCASARRTADEASAPAARTIPLGYGIALPAGETILGLPAAQRYRFVSPDALVRGATSEDVASVRETSGLRANLAVVLQSQGWRESDDSAEYEIAVFVAARTMMRTEVREELVVSSEASGLPVCDASRGGNQPRCTNERNPRTRQVRVSVPYTTRKLYHIVRRRADGAVLYWAHEGRLGEASVERDLLKLFIDQEG